MSIINNKIKKIVSVGIIFLLLLTLGSCKKKVTNESFVKSISNLESYSLEGTLTNYFPTSEKVTKVLVNYQKPNYYVEITNPETNNNQILIKNNDGVHSLIYSKYNKGQK